MKKIDIWETSKSKLDKETLLNSYDDFTMIFEDRAKLTRNVGTGTNCL